MRDQCTVVISGVTARNETPCTKQGKALPPIFAAMQKARSLWPVKTASQLVANAGVSERAAKYWLSGKAGISSGALVNLLRSDHGLEFLEAIVGDAKPEWWKLFRRRVQAAQLEAKIKRLEQELNAVRRGEQEA